MGGFVDGLLPRDLKKCQKMLVQCLGNNPRQVKRFINNLVLNHYLARELEIPDYRPQVLSLLLLLQLLTPPLYRQVAAHPEVLEQLRQGDEAAGSLVEALSRHEGLSQTVKEVGTPDPAGLQRYIYLTRVAGIQPTTTTSSEGLDLQRILEEHREWLASYGRRGKMADLRREDFMDAYLREADLSEANLSGAKLSKANLSKANLSKANLGWVDLKQADLSWANLNKAFLAGANLSEASIRDAGLIGADLSKAVLIGANLRRADLRGADLRDADLREADLSGANLRGADLSDASITKEQIAMANIDKATILPPNLRPDSDQ
jgi:uncharacterized protein YjbI with pentapeptide repeats